MSARKDPLEPGSGLGARLRGHFGAKMVVWIGLAVGICVPYFGLQQLELFRAFRPEGSALDARIAFEPGWIWPYVSISLLVAIAPLLARTRDDLRRYAVGLALLCGTCFAVFLLFPVEGPRPLVAPEVPLYRFIVSVDRPTNSLPSLHVGLVVYSLLYCNRALGGGTGARWLTAARVIGGLWGAAILYSTLATKQHWAIDLPPAIVVAWTAHALAWRRAD